MYHRQPILPNIDNDVAAYIKCCLSIVSHKQNYVFLRSNCCTIAIDDMLGLNLLVLVKGVTVVEKYMLSKIRSILNRT